MPSDRPHFGGLRVVAFESRRAQEVASLITSYGGQPIVAPALREVPLESNAAALRFADDLVAGRFDIVIFLTGVGTRELLRAVERVHPVAAFAAALSRTRVVARGPKPLAVLRELQVPVWIAVPEPNTWRELLAALDGRADEQSTRGARIAVQEYGVSNAELIGELRRRGADVTQVPVYRWELPEDVEPLKRAVAMLARAEARVAIFTTSVQVTHLWRVAADMGLESDLRRGLARTVVASIGPTTSGALRARGISPDIEASHPRLGFLIREAAEQAGACLRAKAAQDG
jgi:uroporphyrinogen-III synthase